MMFDIHIAWLQKYSAVPLLQFPHHPGIYSLFIAFAHLVINGHLTIAEQAESYKKDDYSLYNEFKI